MKSVPETPWHRLPPDEVLGRLDANPQQGLEAPEV